MQARLAAIVPDLAVTKVHGKMPIRDIEEAMVNFAEGKTDVLLATNIIESGLDLPRANTMIVWRPEQQYVICPLLVGRICLRRQ